MFDPIKVSDFHGHETITTLASQSKRGEVKKLIMIVKPYVNTIRYQVYGPWFNEQPNGYFLAFSLDEAIDAYNL